MEVDLDDLEDAVPVLSEENATPTTKEEAEEKEEKPKRCFREEYEGMVWSEAQSMAIQRAIQGENLFITGSGGVGKSQVIKCIIDSLRELGKQVEVAAFTGIAAVPLGGITLHSLMGCAPGMGASQMVERIQKDNALKKRWLSLQTLVIDEISMMEPTFFHTVNSAIKIVRTNEATMGGIQVVAVGDFAQLPPIDTSSNRDEVPALDSPKLEFCFELPLWKELDLKVVELTQIFRQKESHFAEALNRIRFGKHTEEDMQLLFKCADPYRDLSSKDGIKATQLFSFNKSVDRTNLQQLENLEGETKTYQFTCNWTVREGVILSRDNVRSLKERQGHLIKNASAQNTVYLKKGAQVVLLANLDFERELVNGSRGVVVDFEGDKDLPVVLFANGHMECILPHKWPSEEPGVATVNYWQIPLKLAWALTIHKCVSGDTLLSTKNGLVRMEEVGPCWQKRDTWLPVSMEVFGRAAEPQNTSQCYKGLVESGFEVETVGGFILRGSVRHRVLVQDAVPTRHVWKLLPQIEKGDNVILRVGCLVDVGYISTKPFTDVSFMAKSCPPVVDRKMCFLLGLLFGLGRISTQFYDVVVLVSSTRELQFAFCKLLAGIVPSDRITQRDTEVVICCRWFKDFLLWCGLLDNKSQVPWVVMRSSTACQVSFLKGLFVPPTYDLSSFDTPYSSFAVIHKKVSIEIQVLLLNVGILSTRNVYKLSDKKSYWQVTVSKEEVLKLLSFDWSFCEEVYWLKSSEDYLLVPETVLIKTPYTCQMYDISVPVGESFVGNGFVNHNCQGMSLDKCQVSMREIFAPGQAYVALSRVRSEKGLRIINFDPSVIRPHPKVVWFYENNFQPYRILMPSAPPQSASSSFKNQGPKKQQRGDFNFNSKGNGFQKGRQQQQSRKEGNTSSSQPQQQQQNRMSSVQQSKSFLESIILQAAVSAMKGSANPPKNDNTTSSTTTLGGDKPNKPSASSNTSNSLPSFSLFPKSATKPKVAPIALSSIHPSSWATSKFRASNHVAGKKISLDDMSSSSPQRSKKQKIDTNNNNCSSNTNVYDE